MTGAERERIHALVERAVATLPVRTGVTESPAAYVRSGPAIHLIAARGLELSVMARSRVARRATSKPITGWLVSCEGFTADSSFWDAVCTVIGAVIEARYA